MRLATWMTALVLFASAGMPAQGQQAETFGDYEVHYNTLNSNMLTPEIASAYGIQRSGSRAILNITVLNRETRTAVEAAIDVTATNLTGQRRDIELQQINDQGAIYYLGQFRIHDEETLLFDVRVRPAGSEDDPYRLTFRQRLYTR
jgi:hypothetical protein